MPRAAMPSASLRRACFANILSRSSAVRHSRTLIHISEASYFRVRELAEPRRSTTFGRSRGGIRRPSGSNKGPQSKEPNAQRKRVQHGQLRAGHRPRLGFAAFASGVAVLATHSLKTEQIQERGSTSARRRPR